MRRFRSVTLQPRFSVTGRPLLPSCALLLCTRRGFHPGHSAMRRLRSTPQLPEESPVPQPFKGMAVVFLGTGSSVPTPERNVSAIGVKLESRVLLFDCGEGTQQQFIKCPGLAVQSVDHIFITHLHGDHILGVPGMVHGVCCGLTNSARMEPLHVYGPPGLRRFIDAALDATRPTLDVPVFVHELVPPDATLAAQNRAQGALRDCDIPMDEKTGTWTVFRDSKITVKAAPLRHKVPCWGYVVQEAQTQGSIDAAMCTAKGLPPGPLYKELKNGHSVTLPDGTILHPSDVVGPVKRGRKLVILGDTCDSTGIAGIARGADLLIHECTLPRRLGPEAKKRGHSTAAMAGSFAKKIDAKRLILTHFSARSSSPDEESVEDMVDDAVQAFGGPVSAAHDFLWENIPPTWEEKEGNVTEK